MVATRVGFSAFGILFISVGVAACSSAPEDAATEATRSDAQALIPVTITPEARLATCSQDLRVTAGLVSPDVCAGADIFFRETFGGNGRTCGSCHPMANNTTVDVPFLTALHQSNPNDPLFVFETDPALSGLETGDLLNAAAVLENVDGFEDPTNKFVSRAINHVLSLRTSLLPDFGDGTSNPPVERTGWGGDGSPGDGSLRQFLNGAIKQHFTRTLARVEGTDFRPALPLELELTAQFQLSLGRQNELDLASVRITDADAEDGRQAFMDPQRGRCNFCHSNAGANFIDTRLNRNFDTGTRHAVGNLDMGLTIGTMDGHGFVDGGFGSTQPIDGDGIGFPDAFGDGTFNPPPLIEAADTGPFFHNNARGPEIEDAVAFYASAPFNFSPAQAFMTARFGTPLNLFAQDSFHIARFLRVLNTAFNADLALQRLSAVKTLLTNYGTSPQSATQQQLANIVSNLLPLADAELEDALQVMSFVSLYPAVQTSFSQARTAIASARQATTLSERKSFVDAAIDSVQAGRPQLGTNITFQLGQGNLMF